jgi:hypothetical protein
MKNLIVNKIKESAKNNSWSNVNRIIENLNLQLELVQDLPFCKLWIVKNNIEIHSISNTIDYANNGNASINFTFNN